MDPKVYDQNGVDINQTLKSINEFVDLNFQDLIKKKQYLTEENIKKLKILISDLYAIEGLNPKELYLREKLLFKLTGLIGRYYSEVNMDINKELFIIPGLEQ